MAGCELCGASFELTRPNRRYSSTHCWNVGHARAYKAAHKAPPVVLAPIRCGNCQALFTPIRRTHTYCSRPCAVRMGRLCAHSRKILRRGSQGKYNTKQSLTRKPLYTPDEIAELRADPMCVLPGRTLAAQWRKCLKLGIARDQSLMVNYPASSESIARAVAKITPEQRRQRERRKCFRRRIRENPEPLLEELRQLARGHQYAEDLILESFATVLRNCIPAAEAFKLAKAEVNRTSAQPFREQSFNPDIDYAGRETGRQVSRASDIRSARGEG